MDKSLTDLIDIIQFTENVAAKIQGARDESEVFKLVAAEFLRSEQYMVGILLLAEDGSSLRLAETSISPDVMGLIGDKVGAPARDFVVDLSTSAVLSRVAIGGETLQVESPAILEDFLPKPLASDLMDLIQAKKQPSILTPLYRHGVIAGVLAISAPELAEHFIPSVRNLARHIATALEFADEYAERKRTEEALRQSEHKFRAIVENAPDLFTIVERDGTISFVNFVLTGHRFEDIIGTSVYDHVKPELADTYRQTQERVFLTGRPDRIEVIGVTDRVLDCRIAPLEKEGPVEHLMVILTDITDRTRAEEALRQSEARYRQLFDYAPDSVIILDKDGLIIECSHSAMLLYGYSKEEMIGKHISQFMHPSSGANLSEWLPHPPHFEPIEGEIRIVRSDGTLVHLWRKGVPLTDADGNLAGVLAYDRDITDRKRAEELLRKHRDQLENLVKERTSSLEEANTALRVMLKTADQMKAEMAAAVLFNVKRFALPYIEELKKSGLTERQKPYAEMLERSLDEVTKPFLQGVPVQALTLTPTEVTVANLIKQGRTTKEIAELLSMSARTVETHRYNIRTKLGVNNRTINLRTYISSLGGLVDRLSSS